MYAILSSCDPFHAFIDDQERVLARVIAEHTGIIPSITTAESPEGEELSVLRYWVRDRDGVIVQRDVDLLSFHRVEPVKHALRAVLRNVRLDHIGAPIVAPIDQPGRRVPSIETAAAAGYEQALRDYGINLAGDFHPEGWIKRSIDRAKNKSARS